MYHPTEELDYASHKDWLDTGRRAREAEEAEKALKKSVEVKLTRINTNHFAPAFPEWDRFKTQVEGVHGKWHSNLPVDDFRSLLDIYQQIPHEGLNFGPIRFVFDVDHRVYAEWCMSPNEGGKDWNLHRDYQGEGFTSFMDKEVHYELQRKRSESDRGSYEGYLRARQRVLGGLALRAVELFTEWNGSTSPPYKMEPDPRGFTKCVYDDKRNLRGKEGLNDYIERYINFTQPQVKVA